MSIKETFQEDEGEYTIEASNDFGLVRSTAEINIEGRFFACFVFYLFVNPEYIFILLDDKNVMNLFTKVVIIIG